MSLIREIVDEITCPIDFKKRKVYTRLTKVENGELAFCNGCDFTSGVAECHECITSRTIQYSTCLQKKD